MSTEPTLEEEAAIRVRYGDRVVDIELPHGQQTVRMLLLAHDRASWDRYSDELVSSASTPVVDANAIRRHLLWPSLETFNRWSFGVAGHPASAMRALLHHAAGGDRANFCVEPLTGDTPPGVLEHAKLSPEKAAELVATSNSVVPYALISICGVGIALRAPEPAILTSVQAAQNKGKGVSAAARGAVAASVAWSSEPIDGLLAKWPAVVTLLLSQLSTLGGVYSKAIFRGGQHQDHSSSG